MNTAVMFSRQSDEWSTPQELFDALDEEFRFLCDAAASDENHKALFWFTASDDALSFSWSDRFKVILGIEWPPTFWLNCPYSKCRQFVAKAAEEAAKGCTVVMLLPARTDTGYFHQFIWDAEQHRPRPGVEVRFLKGRLKFGNSQNSAPFPSMVVVFRPVSSEGGA